MWLFVLRRVWNAPNASRHGHMGQRSTASPIIGVHRDSSAVRSFRSIPKTMASRTTCHSLAAGSSEPLSTLNLTLGVKPIPISNSVYVHVSDWGVWPPPKKGGLCVMLRCTTSQVMPPIPSQTKKGSPNTKSSFQESGTRDKNKASSGTIDFDFRKKTFAALMSKDPI
jgi:hypothetical protein